MKIVIGGQIEKKEIERMVKAFDDSIETVVKSDMDGGMMIKQNQADYYLGACHTGGGGALAMTMAIAGRAVTETVSMPGKKPDEAKIIQAVKDGKKAFGFTADHAETAVPMILKAIQANV